MVSSSCYVRWPMTEALVALTMALVRTRDRQRWLPWLLRVNDFNNAHFADRREGGGEWWG